MGSDRSLEEVMNSRYTDYQAVSATSDADYHTWNVRIPIPPTRFEYKQFGELSDPYYGIACWREGVAGYVFIGGLTYGLENCWAFETTSTDDALLTADALREIADKLDELNTQLIKERTWLDRLFNM